MKAIAFISNSQNLQLCNGKRIHFSLFNNSPVRSGCPPTHSYPTDLQKLHPGRVLPASQPARAVSDSERVTAFPTRYPPSVSTDRPGTGSDRIWVRSFANTGKGSNFLLRLNNRSRMKKGKF